MGAGALKWIQELCVSTCGGLDMCDWLVAQGKSPDHSGFWLILSRNRGHW